jgi:glycogen debranching enzyme
MMKIIDQRRSMPAHKKSSTRAAHRELPSHEKHERKQRVLTKGAPSIAGSIASAVVVKRGNIFFLAPPGGEVPLVQGHGFGLYYHDCRYLNGYEMTFGGIHPEPLVSTAEEGFRAVFQLCTPDIRSSSGTIIHKETLGIEWERVAHAEECALFDGITIQNFGPDAVDFTMTLAFQTEFEDVFTIRGMVPERTGTVRPPRWKDGGLFFLYEGADRFYRSLSILCRPVPDKTKGTTAEFRLRLGPQERKRIAVSLMVAESERDRDVQPKSKELPDFMTVKRAQKDRAQEEWLAQTTQVSSNSLLINRVIHRSLRDLYVLSSSINRDRFFSAGVPWFVALFGRDSLITSLQTLAFDPHIAEGTLRLLAQYQGRVINEQRDEAPGKILHELRVGELARLGEIPHTPYYGTVDATPLFLILVARHAAWTGELTLFHELRPQVELALEWMARYGDLDDDGYLEYKSSSEHGLANQGWKDSGDAIVNADGKLATPPIALVEVQGYAYMAKAGLAELYRRAGEHERADALTKEAEQLRTRFNKDFWMEEKGFFALALQEGRRPCAVISSNPGQALWTGIIDEEKAKPTVDRLMARDLFSGWGIRTLSFQERRYNPIGYHLGTVWPHDNSLIASGCRRYGFDDAALRICTGILEAAMLFEHCRLPEVFAGFSARRVRRAGALSRSVPSPGMGGRIGAVFDRNGVGLTARWI